MKISYFAGAFQRLIEELADGFREWWKYYNEYFKNKRHVRRRRW
ncbi:MAG: hypothetical protein PHH24_04300 [Candidatus Moranbacteria bacterium]|jgi:hypothetical protein|nr:hypothetical protein [Candidatus Moranbacteria bacterium]MDX9855189.1 hypothetical protein [Candidatus Moranbacteria bacterium]